MKSFNSGDIVRLKDGHTENLAVIVDSGKYPDTYEIRFHGDQFNDTYHAPADCLELVKGNENSLYTFANAAADFDSPGKCNHHFVRYTGLRETYLFCKICDLKKEN